MRTGAAVWRGATVVGLALVMASSGVQAQSRDPRPASPAVSAAPGAAFYANSWALVIGINAYQKVSPRLNYAVADAKAVADALPALGFPRPNVRMLLDGEATRARIEDVLYGEFSRIGPDDRLFVYFAGHGDTLAVRGGEEGYFLPVDADRTRLPSTAMLMEDMKRIGRRIKAKHVLFVMDACFSGFTMARDLAPTSTTDAFLASALSEPVVQVLTAGRKGERAIEREGHGLFTRSLLDALRGNAADERGLITAAQLGAWIESRVTRESEGRMHPQYGKLDGEGQFIFVRAGAQIAAVPPRREPPRFEIREEIRQQVGSLAFTARLEGIEIWLDDQRIGETKAGRALVLNNVAAGTYRVKASKAGHKDWAREIQVTANQRAELVIDIEPLRDEPVAPRPSARPDEAVRRGGELVFLVPAEPPSYDAHREETFGLLHPAAPHYNTLLRVDPYDPTGTRIVGDLARSWTVSPDARTYTFTLQAGVRFHDGSELTSRDVKATYGKIMSPPPGVSSARQGQYAGIEAIEATEPSKIVFRLRGPSAAFLSSLASPWNWIYKADILARDPRWYEKNVMGTGPFVFVEHVRGSHWVAKKNPNYWDRGKPYLDGYRAMFIRDSAGQVAAIRGERAHIQFRGFSPADRDGIVQALGPRATVQESPWNCAVLVAINHERKPFDDARVRRALTLALDRHAASRALSRIAILKEVAGVQVPGTPFATPPAELQRLAGYSQDITRSRAEARRLLREAGVPDGFAIVYKNRGIPMPYEPVGVWLLDQWRQIGVNARQEVVDSSAYYQMLQAGHFELAADFQCGYMTEPDLDLYKFLSRDRSAGNYSRYTDLVLDQLYERQARATGTEERRKLIREFEKRLLDDEAHYIHTLQWQRIIPHLSRVKGWTITPSHYLNQQLDTVWLSE